MNTEEFDITDGKKLLYLVFGASRWEFERIEEGSMAIPGNVETCLEHIRSTLFYLLKNWKNIHVDDRAMAMDGITLALREMKESGFTILGIKRYGIGGRPDDREVGRYAAYLRILQDE
ncbi:MAG: hypothetical protein FWF95_02310 [Syntrophorhabdaceae bacterium]|nr:hypothetical protein [Syntrophorhabdaceae bacterium]